MGGSSELRCLQGITAMTLTFEWFAMNDGVYLAATIKREYYAVPDSGIEISTTFLQ